jgi:hypothetical protein
VEVSKPPRKQHARGSPSPHHQQVISRILSKCYILYLFIITIQLLPLFCCVTDRCSREASASSSSAARVVQQGVAQSGAPRENVQTSSKYEAIVRSVDNRSPPVSLPTIAVATEGGFTGKENELFDELLNSKKVRGNGASISWQSFHKVWNYYVKRLVIVHGENAFHGRSQNQLNQKYRDRRKALNKPI